MAETPLDIASLPCPLGCRWEYDRGTYRFLFGNIKMGWVYRAMDGRVWFNALFVGERVAGDTIHKGASVLLSALGLTPAPAADLDAQLAAMSEEARAAFAAKYGWDKAAPAGRTLTEAEVRRACAWASLIGNKRASGDERNPESVIQSIRAHHLKTGLTIESAVNDEYVGEDITAAIAAATDAKEGTKP